MLAFFFEPSADSFYHRSGFCNYFQLGDNFMGGFHFSYAIYLPDKSLRERDVFKQHGIRVVEEFQETENEAGVGLRRTTVSQLPVQPDEALAHFGRGMSPELAIKMRGSQRVLVVMGAGPFDPTHELLRKTTRCVGQIASQHQGFVVDHADSLTFVPEAFHDIRVSEIEAGELSSVQFGTRAYRHDQGIRSVTMGLEKFGQCNLCISQFPEHLMGGFDALVQLMSQTLIESQDVVDCGAREFDVGKLRNAEVRRNLNRVNQGGSGKIKLVMGNQRTLDGDPSELIGPVFRSETGDELWQEQEAMLTELFGSVQNITAGVEFDSIEEIIQAAKERVDDLLCSGEWSQAGARMKIAITLPKTQEVVWTEVHAWDEPHGEGILLSEPHDERLKSGMRVPFTISRVVDYALIKAGSVIEKGGVDELVRQMGQE